MQFRRLLFLGISALLLISPAWGAVCTQTTLADYLALGSGGCTIGDKLFSGFSYIKSGTGTDPTAAGITVTPLILANGEIGVQFNGPWFAGAGESLDTTIAFDVSVIGGGAFLIEDASLVQSASGFFGTGVAQISEDLCGPIPCVPSGTDLQTINSAGLTILSSHTIFTPVGSVHAIKDILLLGGNGYASISQIQDTFSQTAIPEPASIVLLGSVMIGICGAIRRRRVQGL